MSSSLRFWFLVLFAVLLGLAVKYFAFELFTVPTDSMEPTIKTGAKVWLNKMKFEPYKQSDIIGFHHGAENFVKRITGMPSESVYYNGNYFLAKNLELASPPPINEYAPPPPPPSQLLGVNTINFTIPKSGDTIFIDNSNFGIFLPLIEKCEHVPAGKVLNKIYINNKEASYYVFKQNYYFVEGDNAAVSVDSRAFGLVAENQIIGKVIKN